MLENITKKIFGTPNERYLKNTQKIVDEINRLEDKIEKCSDEELKTTTIELKKEYKSGKSLEISTYFFLNLVRCPKSSAEIGVKKCLIKTAG